MRLKSFDNYLIGTMSLFALLSLYMLYGAKFNSRSSGSEIRVASIVEQIKTVKRKRDFYQSWVDVNPGDELSQNDEIYTHGQSSAKINFENGPQVSLFENSLLRIKSVNKENTLSLDKGNLTATLTKDSPKLDVMLNGKKYSFESDKANIQIEQGATENKFLLLDGKAKLKINQASQDILTNQVLIQDKKTGAVKIKEIPFILKTPLHNSIVYFYKPIEIPFNWSYTSVSSPARIIISKDSTFKDIVHQSVVSENQFTYTFSEARIYYWKLVSTDDVEGPIRTLTLISEHPLPLGIDKEVVYKGPKKAEKVTLIWPRQNARKFLLKIEQPDATEKVIEVEKNNYELVPDQLGIYKASLKIHEENRPFALWSEAISISVLEAKEISIVSNTPELLYKVNYARTDSTATTHLISWSGPDSGVGYSVSLKGNNKTQNFKTENTSILLNLSGPGEYVWSVQGETESGVSTNLISGKIIIRAPISISQSPAEGSVIELEKPDQLVSFKWDEIKNTKKYQFEIATDSEFQNRIYENSTEGNSISTALAKTGKYFWRVKIDQGEFSEYSTPVSVEIKPAPPLSKPEDLPSLKLKLKYLDDKTTDSEFHWIDLFISKAQAENQSVAAVWDIEPNSRAKEYIVEIYKDAELTELVTRIVTTSPHIIWKDAATGTFYWRVSYVDFWGRKTDFSGPSTLSTELDQEIIKAEAAKLAASVPIEMISPKHKEDILENAEDEYLFSWANLPDTKNYQFLVDSDLEFESPVINKKITDNQIIVNCKDFKNTEGDYYWKVTTVAGNSSKRRLFHVECKPEETEPVPEPEIAETKRVLEDQKKISHFFKLGIFPHKLSYTNTAVQYSAKVSGNALNSFYGLYSRPVDWKYFQNFTPSLYVSRGKVFETITFTDFEINLKAGRTLTNFNWGPVLAMIKKTLYVESNLAISDQALSSPLLGIFIQKDIGQLSLNAEIKFGGMLDYHADVQYALKNRISIGAFFDGTSVTKDEAKHSFSRMGLMLNYIFPFLETEK